MNTGTGRAPRSFSPLHAGERPSWLLCADVFLLLTPARRGTTNSGCPRQLPPLSHPCTQGNDRYPYPDRSGSCASHPCTQGNDTDLRHVANQATFSPLHARERRDPFGKIFRTKFSPRHAGERRRPPARRPGCSTFRPCAQGHDFRAELDLHLAPFLTPARRGTTRCECMCSEVVPSHPCTQGTTTATRVILWLFSPAYTREPPLEAPKRAAMDVLTRVRAGTTAEARPWPEPRRSHPRTRGNHPRVFKPAALGRSRRSSCASTGRAAGR